MLMKMMRRVTANESGEAGRRVGTAGWRAGTASCEATGVRVGTRVRRRGHAREGRGDCVREDGRQRERWRGMWAGAAKAAGVIGWRIGGAGRSAAVVTMTGVIARDARAGLGGGLFGIVGALETVAIVARLESY